MGACWARSRDKRESEWMLLVKKEEGSKRDDQRSGGKESAGPYRPWRELQLLY